MLSEAKRISQDSGSADAGSGVGFELAAFESVISCIKCTIQGSFSGFEFNGTVYNGSTEFRRPQK